MSCRPAHIHDNPLSEADVGRYLFIFMYGLGVDVAGWVYFGEVFPTHLRAKGLALCGATIALTDLIYLEAAPTAFANIGWRFYLVSTPILHRKVSDSFRVFVVICTVGVVWMWFALPETKGLPLETVAELFGDRDEVVVYADNGDHDGDTDSKAERGEKEHATATSAGSI